MSGDPGSPFVPFAYELGLRRATGALHVASSGDTLAIREGAVVTSELDALGRRAGGVLADLAALDRAAWSFRPGPAPSGGRALPLAAWVRQHVERTLDVALAARITRELAGARLRLRPAIDRAHLDATDRLLVAALDTPRELRELATMARASRFRLAAFLCFARSVGALIVLAPGAVDRRAHEPHPARSPAASEPRAAALDLLGLPSHADARHVKRAFRALARVLHPDRHPGVGEDRRRELEQRFARVHAAYAALTPG